MDKTTLHSIIWLFGTATFAADIVIFVFIIILAIYFLSRARIPIVNSVVEFVADNFLALGFIVAATATFGSLFLSEIAQFIPCELCWYQRICMYPQTLIFGVALFTNDTKIRKYLIPLSIIGAIIAIYHFFLQMFPLLLPCSDRTANCALVQFKYYGYVTIPMMALTAFVMLILIMVARRRVVKKR